MAEAVDGAEITGPHRVVVVGAGFGGLKTVRALQDVRVGGKPLAITLIDRQNHHLFQPLLYQVATAALSPADIAEPVRALFTGQDNVTVLMDDIAAVDPAPRTVSGRGGTYPYDTLVLATGAAYSYFGNDTWAAHAPALKTLADARLIRRRILLAFERAEMTADANARAKLMTFAIIGGGPTGVEMAGAIAELARSTLARDFRHIDPAQTRILLLEAAPNVLSGFPAPLQDYTVKALEGLGVMVRLDAMVSDIDRGGITLKDGDRIPAATVIWAAGVRANLPGGLDARTSRSGQIEVAPNLSLPDHPDIFCIGDACHYEQDGTSLPGVAPVAEQQGAHAARVIRARLAGTSPPGPFRYRNAGMLATIGRNKAIADLGKIRFKGWLAWMFWGLVHILFLIGFRNRLMVFWNWTWAWLTYGRGARLILGGSRRDAPDP